MLEDLMVSKMLSITGVALTLQDEIQVELGEGCSQSCHVDMTWIVEHESVGSFRVCLVKPSDTFHSKVVLDRGTDSCSASGDTLVL